MNGSNIKAFFSTFFICLVAIANAQISGKITDDQNHPLEFVAVAAIHPTDSTLISYSSTNKEGFFKLTQIPEQQVIFQVHLIGFATHQQLIDYHDKSVDIGVIALTPDNMLDEVVVQSVAPISIKKDTVAYNASSFNVRVDDNVEDLIKKLPGLEVDANGKVEAQGEQVTKIYVDGKEFFSRDPAVVIKNLSADAIKSIEVIDEGSEQARITGVNNAQRTKVLNLTLKEDRKENDFGTFQGGYGTNDRFLNSGNFNRFGPKFQATVIGKYNNVNSAGSDISELLTFNTDGSSNGNSWRGNNAYDNNSVGYLTTGVLGTNLGYDFEKNHYLNLDYFFNHTDKTSGDILTTRIEYVDNGQITTESKSENRQIVNNHKANFIYRDRSKKGRSLSITGSINSNSRNRDNDFGSERFNVNDELFFRNRGFSVNESDTRSGNVNVSVVKRLKDSSRRSINFRVNTNFSRNEDLNYQEQLSSFRLNRPNSFDRFQETTKEQWNDYARLGYFFRYTESLGGPNILYLETEGSFSTRDVEVDQTKYIDGELQNPLQYNLDYNLNNGSGNIYYKYDTNTFVLTVGGKLVLQDLRFGLTGNPEEQYQTKYSYFNPEIRMRYRPERGKQIFFTARRDVTLPNSSQVNPAINNFNSLHIRVGNPDLTPIEKYRLITVFNRYNFSSGFGFTGRLTYDYATNNIIRNELLTDLGVKFYSYENYGDSNKLAARLSFGSRIKSLNLRYQFITSGGLNNYASRINDEINETDTKNFVAGFSLQNNKKKRIDATIGMNFSRNFTTFSNQDVERIFTTQSYYAKADWNITDRFNVNSQFKYEIYEDSSFGDDSQGVPVWNASVSYFLLNSKTLNVKLSALDILDKNIGLIRTSNGNSFQEVNREVLGQYFMFSLTYTHNGQNAPKKKRRG